MPDCGYCVDDGLHLTLGSRTKDGRGWSRGGIMMFGRRCLPKAWIGTWVCGARESCAVELADIMTVGGSTRVAAHLSLDESYLTKSGLTCQARLAPDSNPLPPSLDASTSGAPYTGRVASAASSRLTPSWRARLSTIINPATLGRCSTQPW